MWRLLWKTSNMGDKRHYDLPFAENPGEWIAFILIGLLGLTGTVWFAWREGVPFLSVFAILFLAIILDCIGQLLARLHIGPEGIVITLFGKPLRRCPADEIRAIAAVRKYNSKANPHDVIAVCTNTVEELTELGKKHMPKLLQNEKEHWDGESAAKYLYRRAVSVGGELNLHKQILWMDWSSERLEILRKMYPNTQWLDGTQKKLFDAQLQNK